MEIKKILEILIGLSFLFAVLLRTTLAEEPIVKVYNKLYQARKAGDIEEMMKYLPDAKRQEWLSVPDAQREIMINMMKATTPLNYEVSREKVSPDGEKLLYILRER